jgi:hypothetical protein
MAYEEAVSNESRSCSILEYITNVPAYWLMEIDLLRYRRESRSMPIS